jgi:hypothetical protein
VFDNTNSIISSRILTQQAFVVQYCYTKMSVRVVARIRPLLKNEIDKDVIVTAASNESAKGSQIVRIPNPKNDAELYSFQFNSVYEQETTQQELFDNEGMALLSPLCEERNVYSSIQYPPR